MTQEERASLTVGQQLKAAREAKEITVQQVAESLHITPTYVNLIETDQFHKLPGAVFARGYIKSYAKLLNLATDEIMSCYFDQTDDKHLEFEIPPASNEYGESIRRNAWRWAAVFLAAVFIVPPFIWWNTHRNSSPEPIAVDAGTAELNNIATISPLPVTQSSDITSMPETAVETEVKPTQLPTEAVTSHVTVTPQNTPAIKTGNDTVSLMFSGRCWVQVKNEQGTVLHEAEHVAGEKINVEGKAPFYVWLGNAKEARVLFNEKEIELQADAKGSARLTVGK